MNSDGHRTCRFHPTALVESKFIGVGTVVEPFSHVMAAAVIGRRCLIGAYGFVEDGAVIGDDVTVGSRVALWRGVTLEDGVVVGHGVAFTNAGRPRAARKIPQEDLLSTIIRAGAVIGANATVLPGIRVGMRAVVGAGAVVTRDVPDDASVAGNPARPTGRPGAGSQAGSRE